MLEVSQYSVLRDCSSAGLQGLKSASLRFYNSTGLQLCSRIFRTLDLHPCVWSEGRASEIPLVRARSQALPSGNLRHRWRSAPQMIFSPCGTNPSGRPRRRPAGHLGTAPRRTPGEILALSTPISHSFPEKSFLPSLNFMNRRKERFDCTSFIMT